MTAHERAKTNGQPGFVVLVHRVERRREDNPGDALWKGLYLIVAIAPLFSMATRFALAYAETWGFARLTARKTFVVPHPFRH